MCQKKRIASTAQVALTLLTCSRSDLVGCLVAQLLLRVCVLNSSMSLWCFQVKGKCSQLLFLNYGHSSLSDGNRWVEMHKSRNLYLHVSSQCWSTGGIKCTWHGAPSCHANCRTSLHSRLYKVLIDNRTAVFSHIQSAALDCQKISALKSRQRVKLCLIGRFCIILSLFLLFIPWPHKCIIQPHKSWKISDFTVICCM